MEELRRYRQALLATWERHPDALKAAWKASAASPQANRVLLRLWWWEKQVGYPNLMALLKGAAPSHVLPPLPERMPSPESMLADYRRWRQGAVESLRHAAPTVWSSIGRHPQAGRRTVQWWVERSLAEGEQALRMLEHEE